MKERLKSKPRVKVSSFCFTRYRNTYISFVYTKLFTSLDYSLSCIKTDILGEPQITKSKLTIRSVKPRGLSNDYIVYSMSKDSFLPSNLVLLGLIYILHFFSLLSILIFLIIRFHKNGSPRSFKFNVFCYISLEFYVRS